MYSHTNGRRLFDQWIIYLNKQTDSTESSLSIIENEHDHV